MRATDSRPPHAITVYRIVVAVAGWFGLVLQYWLVISGPIGAGALSRTVNFFSYFTILCNLMVALAMTLPWLVPNTWPARFVTRPAVRTGIAAYIIVVGAVYVLVLRHQWNPRGLAFIADATLHYAMPVLYVFDWLLIPKYLQQPRQTVVWLAFPTLYGFWTVIHGAASGFYPYPFVDVGTLGYARVIANMIGLTILFIGLGLGLSVLKRFIGREYHAAAP